MYEEGYQNRPYSDFIVNNDNQTSEETSEIIEDYIEGAPLIKVAIIPVVLQYSTISPLK